MNNNIRQRKSRAPFGCSLSDLQIEDFHRILFASVNQSGYKSGDHVYLFTTPKDLLSQYFEVQITNFELKHEYLLIGKYDFCNFASTYNSPTEASGRAFASHILSEIFKLKKTMNSPKRVSFANAKDYHTESAQKDYYETVKGEWFGKLKTEFGLSEMKKDDFLRALDGFNPTTGERILPKKINQKRDCAAIDISMTAPKSFSIVVELARAKGDDAIVNHLMGLYNQAIDKTLEYIENEYAAVRVQKKKIRVQEKTGNLLIAKIEHDTSRPVTNDVTGIVDIDPNIHTHCLPMNFSKAADGKFRSLNIKGIFDDKIKNGQFFRTELAAILEENNISIRVTNPSQGFWELSCVNDALIRENSQRSIQIEKEFQRLKPLFPNMNEAKLRQKATTSSREKKIVTIPREKVLSKNLARAEKIVNVDELLASLSNPLPTELQTQPKTELEINTVLDKNSKEIKTLKKFNQTKYTALQYTARELLGQVRASLIFTKIKKREEIKTQTLKTMHDVVIFALKTTKLDTQKLFASLKHIDKHHVEETLENARRASDRDRFIESYFTISSEFSRAESAYNRDVIGIDTTTQERGGISRTDFERDGTDGARTTDSNTFNSNTRVTIEDIRLAEQGYREHVERERLKNKSNQQER